MENQTEINYGCWLIRKISYRDFINKKIREKNGTRNPQLMKNKIKRNSFL